MKPSERKQVNATKLIQRNATNHVDLTEGIQQIECYQINATDWMHLSQYIWVHATDPFKD